MDTKILQASSESIDYAAAILRQGLPVAFPTETVYGLGANAYDIDAVERIFEAKGRPSDNPLIVHVGNKMQIFDLAADVPEYARPLIQKLMPGALTLVLKKKSKVPSIVSGGLDTVGIRIPRNEVASRLLRAAGIPLAAPSANSSGRPSPTRASHVFDDLSGKIPLILDGGDCEIGLESTVLDVTDARARILRSGGVSREQIEALIGQVEIAAADDEKPLSPGTKYTHYAPKCSLLFSAYYEKMHLAVRKMYDGLARVAKPIIFCAAANAQKYGSRTVAVMGGNNIEIAHNLFSLLREHEKGYDCIIVEGIPPSEGSDALINRLCKASGGQIF